MTKQRINVGSGVNTGTGDTLRAAMEKINNNFDELYDLMGQDSTGRSIDIAGNTISSTFTNTDIILDPNGTGDVKVDADLVVNVIRSGDSALIEVQDSLRVTGDLITNNIKSDDSAQVTISDGVTITGAVVMLSNLPTSNPNNAGQLWNDNGTLKVSAG